MCDMQEEVLDPETMSALLSVLGLVSWENICKCVRAMALHMTQIILCDYEIVFQGFSALLVFQGILASIVLLASLHQLIMYLSHISCKAECLRLHHSPAEHIP